MTARAEAASRTGRDILAAAAALWRERPFEEVTLQAIAERAGVSVQTVIRRFGSRDGVIAAAIEADAAGVHAERDRAPVGDVERAVEILVEHYERDGDVILRTLALEEKVAAAGAIVQAGRAAHRAWCARVFAPYLPPADLDADRDEHRARLDAVVAATDVYLWKLIRRDLGRSPDEARRVIRDLVRGLAALPSPAT
jgi:AcrR family transcriptional regulator